MKKLVIAILLLTLPCSLLSGCIFEQKPFIHSLKTGRYICDDSFMLGDLEINYFELELTDGNMMQYVKTDGKSMIKDLFTVNERFQTVLDASITMCINGKTEEFMFNNAKPLNFRTETEYKLHNLQPIESNSKSAYPAIKDLIFATVDNDGNNIAEKLIIKINDVEIEAENTDILYSFTLRDDEGIFGTTDVRDLTYYDYQTVVLCDYDVTSVMYGGSYESKYRMPIITMSDGNVLTPVLVKSDSGSSIDYWLFEFPMPSHDISGTVSLIEVNVSEFD